MNNNTKKVRLILETNKYNKSEKPQINKVNTLKKFFLDLIEFIKELRE